MHNQHAGLSQLLATQRITDRQAQAAQARLGSSAPPDHETHHRRKTMYKPTRRRRAARRAAARVLAIAAAAAALTATLAAGQALAVLDERVLERQGRIDHQAATAQADEQGKAEKSSQSSSTRFARRHLRPEPPMGSGSWVNDDGSFVPAPAPKAPAHDRDSLAVAAAAVALLLGLGAAATWRIHRHRPRPEPTT
jgi:hypothetical protein